jgi:hypothetical protein
MRRRGCEGFGRRPALIAFTGLTPSAPSSTAWSRITERVARICRRVPEEPGPAALGALWGQATLSTLIASSLRPFGSPSGPLASARCASSLGHGSNRSWRKRDSGGLQHLRNPDSDQSTDASGVARATRGGIRRILHRRLAGSTSSTRGCQGVQRGRDVVRRIRGMDKRPRGPRGGGGPMRGCGR